MHITKILLKKADIVALIDIDDRILKSVKIARNGQNKGRVISKCRVIHNLVIMLQFINSATSNIVALLGR